MTPSYRQKKVYDTWDESMHNLLIEAVAGSGKTTLLLELLKKCDGKATFLAFNKSIQTEIQDKIDKLGLSFGKASTMHSIGYSAVRKHYNSCELLNSKNYKLAGAIETNHPEYFKNKKSGDKYKLKQMLMNMNDVSRIYLTDNVPEIIEHMVDMDKQVYEDPAIGVLWEKFIDFRDFTYTQKDIKIDFIDMIYIPVKYDVKITVDCKYLFIDEAQDLNSSQHILIEKIIEQNDIKRWVAVGDRKQAIYNFSGAHAESFDLFKHKENVIELPLDICYRCPVDVVTEANKVYDIMDGFKKEPGIVKIINDYREIKNESMVVCRNTSPLFAMYFKLVTEGKPAYLRGEDILNRILNFLKQYKFYTIAQLQSKVIRKMSQLKQNDDGLSKYQADILDENLESVDIMLEGNFITNNDSCDTLISKLRTLFKEKKGGIMLCTIHKSKGLESDVVYLLRPELIPSKFAKSPSQREQENNLKYVAITRAKSEFYYLDINNKMSV